MIVGGKKYKQTENVIKLAPFIHLASALIRPDKTLSASGFPSTLARCCQLLWVSSVCVCVCKMLMSLKRVCLTRKSTMNLLIYCFPLMKVVATFLLCTSKLLGVCLLPASTVLLGSWTMPQWTSGGGWGQVNEKLNRLIKSV